MDINWKNFCAKFINVVGGGLIWGNIGVQNIILGKDGSTIEFWEGMAYLKIVVDLVHIHDTGI